MQKLILTCPHCQKIMKISNKIAKYRCPHCKEIYVFHAARFLFQNIKYILESIVFFPKNLWQKLHKKYRDAKATYQYMKQVQANLKRDPNWSAYRKQQEAEKAFQQKSSFWDKWKSPFSKR